MADTNILVSSALNGAGDEARLLYQITAGQIAVYATVDVIAEYEETLTRRKFAFAAERVGTLLEFLRTCASMVEPHPDPSYGTAEVVNARQLLDRLASPA